MAQSAKDKLGAASDADEESSRIRIHRAICWLARAEQEAGDPDAHFMFLRIAFNTAYAKAFGFEGSLRATDRIPLSACGDRRREVSRQSLLGGSLRTLIATSRHSSRSGARCATTTPAAIGKRSSSPAAESTRAVLDGHIDDVLGVVFDSFQVLRNQLVYGGATWAVAPTVCR